jgi:hypothetical protein
MYLQRELKHPMNILIFFTIKRLKPLRIPTISMALSLILLHAHENCPKALF